MFQLLYNTKKVSLANDRKYTSRPIIMVVQEIIANLFLQVLTTSNTDCCCFGVPAAAAECRRGPRNQ